MTVGVLAPVVLMEPPSRSDGFQDPVEPMARPRTPRPSDDWSSCGNDLRRGEHMMGESFRRRDGRVIPASVERLRYSTPAHLALEQRLVDRVAASRQRGVAVARAREVKRAIAARPTLSPEQREVFALSAAREAWQAAGHPVLGVAIARRAAREVREGAGKTKLGGGEILPALGSLAVRMPASMGP